MYCGLDFGTSNSLCSIEGNQGQATLVHLDQDMAEIPSAVFYPAQDIKNPVFGREAVDQYIEGHDGRLLRSFKRLLGTKYFASGTKLTSSKALKFRDLFISFIKHVKAVAEQETALELTHVVIGRPVRFSEHERDDKSGEDQLSSVANSLGFKHVEFQYEPIAAAFAHEQILSGEKLALVADIGGGTSDFSLIRLGPQLREASDRKQDVLAYSGIAIGGTDFDSVLSVSQVMEALGYRSRYGKKELAVPNWPYLAASDWNRIVLELYLKRTYLAMKNLLPEAKEPNKLHRFLSLMEHRRAHHLLKEVEAAKIALSSADQAIIYPNFIEEGLAIEVKRASFEQDMTEKVAALESRALITLQEAGIKSEQVDLIIMTGGASAMPIIQDRFMQLFPQATLSAENRMGSVCEGLLYDAKRKFGIPAQ